MTAGRTFLKSVKEKAVCQCGEHRHELLEFAHHDRANKCMENGKKVDLSSMKCQKKIAKELSKGRFLCVTCHRDETHNENKILTEKYIQSLVLKCTHCSTTHGKSCAGTVCQGRKQHSSNFNLCKSKCDACLAVERIQRRKIKQNFINEMKLNVGGCEYCNETCKKSNCHLFEWDHIFGKNKNVSKLLSSSVRVISNEIFLCRLLCAKCHRLKSTLESRSEWDGRPSSFSKIINTLTNKDNAQDTSDY